MSDSPSRFPWGALVIGLLIGIAGGLYYAWFLNPVNFDDISPDRLDTADQQEYVRLVADAYLQNGDAERARARIAALGVSDPAELVKVQADTAYLSGDDVEKVRALTTLAEALGAEPLALDVFSLTSVATDQAQPPAATITPTFLGVPTNTLTPEAALPTLTPTFEPPTATPDLFPETDLDLSDRETVCVEGTQAGRIEVWVYDRFEEGLPGVEVLVEWEGGQDTFYTGLKPSIDPGYADFMMEAEQVYTVTLVGLAEPVVGLESTGCQTDTEQNSIPTHILTFIPSSGFVDE